MSDADAPSEVVVLSIRMMRADYDALEAAASRLRMPISSYARMLIFEGTRDRAVRDVFEALQADPNLRLRLRQLIMNPSEG